MPLQPDDIEDMGGHFVQEQSTPPTAAAGAGAGSGPPAVVVAANASDQHGSLTCGTGTSPAAGILVTVTLKVSLGQNSESVEVVSPANAASAALTPSVVNHYTSGALTSFDIVTLISGVSQGNTIYAFDWICE
jgi:hypothetical protein